MNLLYYLKNYYFFITKKNNFTKKMIEIFLITSKERVFGNDKIILFYFIKKLNKLFNILNYILLIIFINFNFIIFENKYFIKHLRST